MPILLRDASRSDLRAVARIQRLCFAASPIDPRSLGDVVTTVAEYDGYVCGYCIASFRFIPSRLLILSIAVHPEFRRAGIGTELVEAMQCAAVIAERRVRLVGGTDNWPLAALLHSVGFRIISQAGDLRMFEWGGRGDDMSAMVRRLQSRPAGRPLPR